MNPILAKLWPHWGAVAQERETIGHTPQPLSEPQSVEPKDDLVPEYLTVKARKLVLEYMMSRTDECWDVHFITTSWQGKCLNVHIWNSNPGQIIGYGDARMKDMRSYIGAALKMPVFVSAKHQFNPFKDSLPTF